MSALKAGTGYVELLPDFKEAEFRAALSKKLDAAGKLAGTSFQNAFSGKLKAAAELAKANPALIGGGVVVGLAVAIKKVADETAAYASEIRGLKGITGESAEDASRLVGNMHALGLETSGATRPFATLIDELGKGGGKLKEFFSTQEIGQLRTNLSAGKFNDVVLQIGDRFKDIQDPAKRVELVMAALGKRGLEYRALLAQTRDEWKEINKNTERSGLIFGDKQLDDARRYQIAIRELGETFRGLKVEAGKLAIPLAANFATNLTEAIHQTEDLAHKGGAVRSVFSFIGKDLNLATGEVFSRHKKSADEAKASTDRLRGSLDGLVQSAASDDEAAKRMGDLFKQAFSDIDNAAAAFDKRLDALIPKLGETFKLPKIGDVDFSAGAQTAASDKLTAAQDKLANAEDHLAKVRANKKHTATDIARAERDIATARDGVTKATDAVRVSHIGLSDALERTIRDNAGKTSRFANDLSALNARFANIATRGGEEVEQSFLSHLADLGPGSVPLFDDLLRKSDGKLGELAGLFGDQIAAAKKAADFQFDKYPANFAQKIEATRKAAIGEGTKLIDEFNALGDNPQLQEKLGDQITGFAQLMELKLGPSLSKTKLGLLHIAETGDTAADKVQALQQFLEGLKSKSVDVKVNILENVPSTDPLAILLAGGVTHRADGGSVLAGRDYLVGERGPEILRMGSEGSGRIVPNDQLRRADAPSEQARPLIVPITVELDGEVLARKTVRHNGRAAESYRRERA